MRDSENVDGCFDDRGSRLPPRLLRAVRLAPCGPARPIALAPDARGSERPARATSPTDAQLLEPRGSLGEMESRRRYAGRASPLERSPPWVPPPDLLNSNILPLSDRKTSRPPAQPQPRGRALTGSCTMRLARERDSEGKGGHADRRADQLGKLSQAVAPFFPLGNHL